MVVRGWGTVSVVDVVEYVQWNLVVRNCVNVIESGPPLVCVGVDMATRGVT